MIGWKTAGMKTPISSANISLANSHLVETETMGPATVYEKNCRQSVQHTLDCPCIINMTNQLFFERIWEDIVEFNETNAVHIGLRRPATFMMQVLEQNTKHTSQPERYLEKRTIIHDISRVLGKETFKLWNQLSLKHDMNSQQSLMRKQFFNCSTTTSKMITSVKVKTLKRCRNNRTLFGPFQLTFKPNWKGVWIRLIRNTEHRTIPLKLY
ncbi:uncharacterized protein EV154DRAFT_486608 [Mucor mucedo]|uniref:uncharacterized protein n=1 Tax=Mucor mucedo TaxID=29922 RepID=UPI002220A8CB|nr:uncharacterized protein EV154DRAFT_486608 [Mucor mucedo]KAI7875933.1 hypothetical protein EV154DRAFT_486608 [Mucor mucedo]